MSAGFGGEVRIWRAVESKTGASGDVAYADREVWHGAGEVKQGLVGRGKKKNAGECWAVSLNEDGRWLAGTSYDGKVRIWDLEGRVSADDDVNMLSDGEEDGGPEGGIKVDGNGEPTLMHEVETRGGFGMAVDIVRHSRRPLP